MPTYEYACKNCGEHLEVVQSFKDDPLTECPACGGPLRKVFGSIGISFKGSGFYRTDSRMPSRPEKKSDATKSESDRGSKDSKDSKAGDSSKSDSGAAKSDGPAKADGPAKSDGAGGKTTPKSSEKTA